MPLVVPSGPAAVSEKWVTIDLGPDFGSFEILVRRPNWAALVGEMSDDSGDAERRIRDTVVNWRGVQDDKGAEIPFSFDALKSVCEAAPGVAWFIHREARTAFYAAPEADLKNSEGTSSESDAAAKTSPIPAP